VVNHNRRGMRFERQFLANADTLGPSF